MEMVTRTKVTKYIYNVLKKDCTPVKQVTTDHMVKSQKETKEILSQVVGADAAADHILVLIDTETETFACRESDFMAIAKPKSVLEAEMKAEKEAAKTAE